MKVVGDLEIKEDVVRVVLKTPYDLAGKKVEVELKKVGPLEGLIDIIE